MSEPAIEHTEEGYTCPECSETFKLAMHLGTHRKAKHGVQGSSAGKSKSGTARKSSGGRGESRHTKRKRAVKETLTEFLDFTDEARGRSNEPPRDLADVLRRDADKLADSLAWVAERFNPVGWFIDTTMGHGSIVTVARGFLGVGTWMLAHWRTMLQEREDAALLEPEYVHEAVSNGNPEPGTLDSADSFVG